MCSLTFYKDGKPFASMGRLPGRKRTTVYVYGPSGEISPLASVLPFREKSMENLLCGLCLTPGEDMPAPPTEGQEGGV